MVTSEANVPENVNNDTLGKKIIVPDEKGFQLSNSLKTRCSSGRNL